MKKIAYSIMSLSIILGACQSVQPPSPTITPILAAATPTSTITPILATATLTTAFTATPILATNTPAPIPTHTVTPSTSIQTTPKPKLSVQVMLDPTLKQKSNAFSSWLIYGIARNKWISSNYPDLSSYKYLFAEEFDARETLVKVWIELSGTSSGENDTYLEELAIVYRAGYLKEYVWTYFHYEDPTPPDGLRLPQYTQWVTQNLPQHRVQTHVGIQIR
jgi:hypothetical protein